MNKMITKKQGFCGVLTRIVSILLCASLLFSLLCLTSCHGADGAPAFEVPSGLDPERTYNITFWAKNDSNPVQVEIYNNTIERFEKCYPNINVTLKRYTDYGKIYNDVLTNIATSTTPNVCITYPDHIATYLTGENVVVPLDSLISDPRFGLGGSEVAFDGVKRDEMVEQFMSEGKIGDVQYAIPFMRSTEACYVNVTMVEAMGYTIPDVMSWDFVFEVSRAAMEKNPDGTYRGNGKDRLIPFIYKSTDNMMIQMLKQKGAEYSNMNGEILIFNDDTKDLLLEISELTEDMAFSTFGVSSYPGNWFNAGECLFAIDSTAGATWMGPDAPLIDIPEEQLADFEVGVYPIPQFDTGKPQMISQGPSVCIFNKEDPEEVLASWLFAQYLLTDEVQIAFSGTEGYIPVTERAQSSAEYQDYLSRAGEDNDTYYDVKIAASEVLLGNTENTFITPVFYRSADLRNAAGQMIEEVVKSVNRKQTVDAEYIDALYEKMMARYKLNEAASSLDKPELGELPWQSAVLIGSIALAFIGMGAYLVVTRIREERRK